jgi:excisionase family DNA binding protein
MEEETTLGKVAVKETLTPDEAAELLGIGRALCYEQIRLGNIPSVRLGRKILVLRPGLLRILNGGE